MIESTTRTRYRVEGMDCAGCATKIDRAVRPMPGVADVAVSVPAGTLTVHHTAVADLDAIRKKVDGLGYNISISNPATSTPQTFDKQTLQEGRDNSLDGHDHAQGEKHQHEPISGQWWKSRKGLLTVASGLALVVAYGIGKLFPEIAPWAFAAALLIGLVPIGRRAIMAALAGSPFSIEMLMTIAAVGALIIGAGEEAAAVVFLFLVGELLEGMASAKARASIQSLADLVPKTALLEADGQTREVPAGSLAIGMVILARPGDRIPADGVIVSGESSIDEAPVTGESVPLRKGVDSKVFAGTVNGDAALRIRVTAAASDNTISRVIKLVEEAQESKAPTERFIDRFSRWYTPAVVIVAALVAVVPPLVFGAGWDEWIYKGLALLLIGCPCALVISTPAAIAAALSAGARRGLLLKGGAVLEILRKVQVVALDKTGTLTEGKPKVTDVVGLTCSETDVIKFAAALETGSSHPLAKAILDRAAAAKVSFPSVADARAIGGKGVTATVDGKDVFLGSAAAANERAPLTTEQSASTESLADEGKTVSILMIDNTVAGIIAMRDEPRADALAGLRALTDSGLQVLMLTGDNSRTASAIGKKLGIEVRAGLLPEDKLRIINEIKSSGQIVAKVGDGINDAPALAAADVGIAMGGGTDVALETAEAAVLHGRVADVAAMIDLSKRTMRNIHQNITVSLGLKAVFLVTTILGITGLWPAILADTGATVLVTANAMRLLRARA